jgi:aminoglycoside phosphotransferase (APT) family kinase protein
MECVSTPALPATLERWLGEHLEHRGPYAWHRLTGGNSNHTYLLEGEAARMILRRPPEALIDPSAHSVQREHRILQALAQTDVPAPRPFAFCSDLEVLGVPFLVMQYVPGHALTDTLPSEAPPQPRAAAEVAETLVDALATLSGVDWRAVGLEDFGRPDGFLARQVGRWTRQYERVQVRELPRFEEVARWLSDNLPEAGAPGIVHGDFHADNTLVDFRGQARVRAILDWEMATIGDPLLDLGLLLGFWGSDRRKPLSLHRTQAFSRAVGTPSRAQLADRYELTSGRSVEHLDYYMTLAFWKLAAIVEGAYANSRAGLDSTAHARSMEHEVPRLLAEAAHFCGLD